MPAHEVRPRPTEMLRDPTSDMLSKKLSESQGHHRITILGGFVLSVALFTYGHGPAFGQGTPEQQAACTPDVFRLCSDYMPDADRITACLMQSKSLLSKGCRDALFERPAVTQELDQKRLKQR